MREESGTARPVQRLLTSQLSAEVGYTESEQRQELAAELTRILFPVLLEIYSASAGPGVRQAALQAMLRMVVHTQASLLEQVLNPPFLSSQVAAMLSSQDLKIIVSALQLSETLLTKLPEQFSVQFRREGVLHQVQKLTDPDYSISLADSSDSSLNMSWSSNNPTTHTSRSWTIAGSSFVNMFPGMSTVPVHCLEFVNLSLSLTVLEHLRQRSREEGGSTESPSQPMRLSDMLKVKLYCI